MPLTFATGTILSEREEDKEFPVAYSSCKLHSHEHTYATMERECLAVK